MTAANFVPNFPWIGQLTEDDLSTKRGFTFQYPPFPSLTEATEDETTREPPTGIYMHFPFCSYRCSFCYYSVALKQGVDAVDDYLDVLNKELELVSTGTNLRDANIKTMFWGGGTPTYLNEAQLERVMQMAHEHMDLTGLDESTIESDPASLSSAKLQRIVELGFNRLSIGVQSFSSDVNAINQRNHTEQEALDAIEMARAVGIDNINVDLICGLVGETASRWKYSVDRLLDVSPEHVTVYLLSLRPKTALSSQIDRGKQDLPANEEVRINRFRGLRDRLLTAGYVQTTPNCFVREPRYEQIHQRNAWSSLPLVGFGNSSYSYFNGRVTQNVRSISKYKSQVRSGQIPAAIGQKLTAQDEIIRYLVLKTKLLSVSFAEFQDRFGFSLPNLYGDKLYHLESLDLLEVDESGYHLTPKGIIYVDDVCRTFYGNDVRAKLIGDGGSSRPSLLRSLI